jgi:hypothetical protein
MSAEKRDLLDSLVLRAPAVGTAMTAGLVRLKLGSPLRGRLMHAAVRRGFSAMARSDVDVNVLLYEPGTEVWMHGMETVGVGGLLSRTRGGPGALLRHQSTSSRSPLDEWRSSRSPSRARTPSRSASALRSASASPRPCGQDGAGSVPLNVIRRQLGHANLGVTSIYLQGIDTAEIVETVRSRRGPVIPAAALLAPR